MHEEDLDRANELISSASALTLAPSRFLGHYVVAQLAARHGLTVHLVASPAGGLTAMVALPAVLLGLKPAPAPEVAEDGAAPELPVADPERPAIALPRRESAVDSDLTPAERAPVAPIAFRAAAAPPPLPPELAPEASPESPLVESSDDDGDQFDDFTAFDGLADTSTPDAFDELGRLDEIDAREDLDAVEELDAVEAIEVAEPEPQPEPPAPKRPRLGLGTFADLRGASTPQPAPAAESVPSEPSSPASAPEPVAPAAATADPDRPPMLAPDRRASFSEVAQAVEVAAGRPAEPAPASPFSEDLLPQRLPKRGRRNSKLETPWVRQRPVVSEPAAAPEPTASGAAPSADPAPGARLESPGPLPSRGAGPGESQATSVPAPEANGATGAQPESGAAAPVDGGERFAFFAAFRAAAEQAREEAGIDDRRGH
jgi:hypothetical protein